MAIDCTTTALQDAGLNYCCIPAAIQQQVIIYLLNVISGLNLTPQQLIENAREYQSIPRGMEQAVILYLLCANADAAGAE